jgi:hypothetical protein
MKILSIDVGIRNLAMCLLDDAENLIEQWDVSGIPPQHEDGIYVSLRKHLDDRAWTLTADVTLIEKQPDRNKKMKSVENFLHAYFVIKNPRAETIIYDARHKIPDVAGPGRAQYLKRKKTSIERCKEFIHTGETNAHWIPVFNTSKKKDDLADTVMQALSYTRRTEVTSTAPKKKKSTKIIPRKPNENQKATKYSKSNLAWIYKNKPACEVLENNKRFMKDLHRYYRSLQEFEELL